jgi:hypothetical protein
MGSNVDSQSRSAVYVDTAALSEGWRRTSTFGIEVSSSSNEPYCAAMVAGAAYNRIAPTHTRALPVRAIRSSCTV